MSPRVLKRSPWNCGKNSLTFFLSSTYLRMFHVLDLEENSCFVCLLCFSQYHSVVKASSMF